MNKLTRYILRELLQVFLLTLGGLTALIFVGLVGREAVKHGLGLGPLLRMTPYMLPEALQYTVPGTMLLATTSVFGRISSSNEIIAAKSLGISPWRLATPAFALAGIISVGAVAVNDLAVSWGRLGVQRIIMESAEEVIYGQLRLHRGYAKGGLQINVAKVVGKKLIKPRVTVHEKDGEKPWTLESASAELRSSEDRQKLIVRFDGIHLEGPLKWADASTIEREIDLSKLFGVSDGARSPSDYALSEIAAERVASNRRLAGLQQRESHERMLAMMTGDFERLSDESWGPIQARKGGDTYRLQRLAVEPHRRWSTGFSCLSFVLVGVPMAIWRQKGEFLASFFLCFLPILLVYYPLLVVSVDHAKDGDVPPVAVWLGNAVLAVWGLWMMRRVAQN